MTAPTIPAQRAQVVPCETCGELLPNLLATCKRLGCLAADIDDIVRADRRREACDE